jgi:hypothetical protein
MTMAEIGQTLRDARLAAGVTLEEAERRIRIRVRYLRCLEEEDWGALPGDVYLRGFLRTYADFLGLEGTALVDEYDRQAGPVEPEHPMEVPVESPRGVGPRRMPARLGAIIAIAAAALVALFAVLAITGGSSESGKHGHHAKGGKGGGQNTTTTTSTPSKASVRLTPTGTVWVCLVDQSGKALVNGETLSSGDARGPFESGDLKLTLGNGAIQIELNGKPVTVPSAANPIGLDLTPTGAKPLSASQRPTCT